MSNENSLFQYENGVTPYAMSALTDSGDRKNFTSSALLFSANGTSATVVRPNGLVTGGIITPAVSGDDNKVDVSAITCYLAGVLTTISASTDVAIARDIADSNIIGSVTITSGGVVSVVSGSAQALAFSETRGAIGGPPFILTGSIEIGQVRLTSITTAVILAAEIFQVPGTHLEKFDLPTYSIDNFEAEVNFTAALPASHTGGVAKEVFASYNDPIFVEQDCANDFVPAANSHSVSSTQVYGKTVGTASSSLGQGSFTAILKNGITDSILAKKNLTLFFRYFQDSTQSANILTQGKLGVARTFVASDNPTASMTISASAESVEKTA